MDLQPLKALVNESNKWIGLLLMAVLVSGVAVSYAGHENRRLHNILQQELDKKNKAQVEWGRLLLQQSTLTAPDRVEKIARNELAMEVPGSDRIQVLAP
ncbi:cell division protein FtsL [Endozoicomonas sp. OPT23]|uniref:cell division protein FtsL n=1 Tax=Endozoicomonas sp. OPT23 TaxID=2072845 RepID=UPI00129A3DC9|nr:cell division protein FtsL [Endozoicomonas sp. OPT23]MRI35385.1 cell division protein FtsL [Endozoicomonas sp. OPT23]